MDKRLVPEALRDSLMHNDWYMDLYRSWVEGAAFELPRYGSLLEEAEDRALLASSAAVCISTETWARSGRMVLRYDRELLGHLSATSGDAPLSCLESLPFQSFWADAPVPLALDPDLCMSRLSSWRSYDRDGYDGFFVTVEDGYVGVWLVGVGDPNVSALFLRLELGDTLSQSVAANAERLRLTGQDGEAGPELVAAARRVVGALVYLCTLNADVGEPAPARRPQRRNGKREPQALVPKVVDVGYRVGADLAAQRKAASSGGPGTGRTVAPHLRRAHFHSYWTGPRDGERKLVVKWLAPVMVNAQLADETATVRRVR